MNKRIPMAAMVMLIGIVGLLITACGQPAPAPAPAGPTADEIRSIVQQEVANVPAPAPAPAPAMPEPGPSAEEIAMMVEDAVSGAVPEGVSASEIEGIVDAAMMAASEDDLTEGEVAEIVAMEVQKASAGQAEPLTADEVNTIVMTAIEAIPTPEPVVIPTPAMMMEPSGEPIKIGSVLDFTGDLGAYGKPMRNAVDIAAELINDAGGVLGSPVRAVHKDGGTSAQVATDAANALVKTDGVPVIVGPLGSGFTIAVAQAVTIPNEVVQISPSATSPALSILEDSDFLYRTAVSDAAQGVVLARLARELGYETAGLLYVNNAYGEGLARVFTESFEEAGGTVTASVPQEPDQPSYVSELENATDGDPDVLVAMSYPVSAGVYLREAIEGDYIDNFMFVDGTKSQDMFDTLGAENFEGFYGTAPGAQESDSTAVFRILYEERFGELPTDPFLGETFDAFAIAALAIEKAGEYNGPAVRDAMREVANAPGIKVGPGDFAKALDLIRRGEDIDYEGVAGSQNFDENGDVLNTIEIWKIEGGAITSTGRFETP
ncbi:MAG: ABC transporter substrate-binding protein [Chloroflexi bacterium]|nr:ABC transporter substrate-binding protein [Chloroflexota bacterium]